MEGEYMTFCGISYFVPSGAEGIYIFCNFEGCSYFVPKTRMSPK